MIRRKFLGAAGAVTAWTAASAQRVLGANDRINAGVIGCGGRGALDARLMRGTPEDMQVMARGSFHDGKLDPRLDGPPRGVDIVALCDVHQMRLDQAKQWAPAAKTYSDFRRLLEQKDIDVVILATPDHWHALPAILAIQAGKDIYLEKPVAYSIGESRAVFEAAKRSNRMVVVGTQHRSQGHIAEAAQMVQSGKIGKVNLVRAWGFGSLPSPRRPSADAPVPAGLDWDFWLGPAPKVPFNPDRLDYRQFLDYSAGWITDYGAHRFDSIHQITGVDKVLTVSAVGGIFDKGKPGDTPDIHLATYQYPGFILHWESNGLNGHGTGGRTPGMRYYRMSGPDDRPGDLAFYGTEATLFVDRISLELYPEPLPSEPGAGRRGGGWKPRMEKIAKNSDEPTPLHIKNFVETLRSRKPPFASIEAGHYGTAVTPLLAMIALAVGRTLRWDAGKEVIINDPEANRLLMRQYRKPWKLPRIS